MAACEVFTDYIVQCTTELQVNALLAPATQYKWVLEGRFGAYSGYATTDGNGFFAIPITDLPDGLLSQYGGEFTLKITDATDQCRSASFKMAKYYDEICFHVKPGIYEKASLGCVFDCVSPSGGSGNSAIFPITAQATAEIPWTNLLNDFYGNSPLIQVYEQTSPGVYELINVSITQNRTAYTLESISINFGGTFTGYILIS